jgi:acyl-CoA dehydrogenase
MEFEYSDRCKDLQEKLLKFMDEHIYPNEKKIQGRDPA